MPFNRIPTLVLLALALYPNWLAMMVLHEAGHVLHAWLSGATVSTVHVPLAGFSITLFSTNPHPHFVAWGGAIWGCVLPVTMWTIFQRFRWRARRAVQFFAGFCLIANGVYLGAGWTMRAGDAADLVRYGTPVWVLVAFGGMTTGAGLYVWHVLGKRPSRRPSPPSTGERE